MTPADLRRPLLQQALPYRQTAGLVHILRCDGRDAGLATKTGGIESLRQLENYGTGGHICDINGDMRRS